MQSVDYANTGDASSANETEINLTAEWWWILKTSTNSLQVV